MKIFYDFFAFYRLFQNALENSRKLKKNNEKYVKIGGNSRAFKLRLLQNSRHGKSSLNIL